MRIPPFTSIAVSVIAIAAAATAQTIPAPRNSTQACLPPRVILTNFRWYDSAHNIDCGGKGPDVGDGKICSNELPTGPADVSPATESESSSSSDSSSSDDDDGEDSDGDDNGDDGDGDNDSNSAPTNSTSIFSTILATNLTTNNANDTANCNRISLCSTGVPTLWPNGAPPGYGPADWLFINVTNFGACNISSLNGLMPYVPISGGDTLKCGGTAYRVNFRADSSQANSTGTLRVTGPYECNPGGGGASVRGQVSAEAKIPITCSHDSGRNATCSSDASGVDLTVLSFEPATPFQ